MRRIKGWKRKAGTCAQSQKNVGVATEVNVRLFELLKCQQREE